jgi:hypothetical protein
MAIRFRLHSYMSAAGQFTPINPKRLHAGGCCVPVPTRGPIPFVPCHGKRASNLTTLIAVI